MASNAVLLMLLDELSDDTLENFSNSKVTATVACTNLCTGALLMLKGSDSSEEDPVRIHAYVETTVSLYSAVEFKSHFRMSRSTFEELCTVMAPFLSLERSLTVEQKVLATLWLISNKESYRSVSDSFGISKGTLHLIAMNACNAISSLVGMFIKFPGNTVQMTEVANGFKNRCGFPGVIGAIDGTHIPIPAPVSEHRSSYINRKGFASVQLQVVCDSHLKFLDIFTGYPGSVHDARVYRNSPIFEAIHSLPEDFHVLGDSAYPLHHSMMVPYRDNGHLDDVQKKFNKAHSSTRVDVERAIGLLKCKFRRLLSLDMLLVQEIPVVISACCVLHNFILDKDGEEFVDCDLEDNDSAPDDGTDSSFGPAEAKRRRIAFML